MKHIQKDELPKQEQPAPSAPRLPRSAYCAYCGAALPANNRSCVICGAVHGKLPSIPSLSSGGERGWKKRLDSAHAMYSGRRRLTLTAFLMIAVFLLGGMGVAAYEYFSYQFTLAQYTAADSALYVTGDKALKISMPALAEPLTILEDYAGPLTAAKSHDARSLAYLDSRGWTGTGDRFGALRLLSLVSLSDGEGPHDGELLAEDVVDFRFLPRSDRLFYVTQEGGLYLCDYSQLGEALRVGSRVKTVLLDTDVRCIAEISGRFVAYGKGERAGAAAWSDSKKSEHGKPFDLYLLNFEEAGAQPILAGESVNRVEDFTREFERIVFSRRTRSSPLIMYDVFLFQRRDASLTQLARDARWVVNASASKGAALCLSPSEETLGFKDVLDDDLLLSDQMMSEPRPSDYGLDANTAYIDELDPAVIEEMYQRYETDFKRFEEKLARDQLRKSLREQLRAFMQDNYLSYGLFYTDGVTTLKLADQIYNRGEDITALVKGSVESGSILFARGEREALGKMIMSELEPETVRTLISGSFNVMEFISENMPEFLWYSQIGKEPQEVFPGQVSRVLDRYFFTSAGDGIYFSSLSGYQAEDGTLYYAALANGAAGSVVHVLEDVTQLAGASEQPAGLVFAKLTRGNPALRDLCFVSGGTARIIATRALPDREMRLFGEGMGAVSYYRRTEGQTAEGLYINQNQERFIAQAVSKPGFYDTNLIYLLRQGDAAEAGLYLYKTGEITLIDKNVADVLYPGLK